MRLYKMLAVISLVFFLSGCNHAKKDAVNMNTATSPVYSDEQLLEISGFAGTKDELTAQYPTDYIRTLSITQNKSDVSDEKIISIIYRGDNKVLQVIFDILGNKLSSRIYNSTLSKKDFESLSIGQSLSDVQALDPDGDYLFLYTGTNDIPKVSSHYTTDGFIISIRYNSNNMIEIIDMIPIEDS